MSLHYLVDGFNLLFALPEIPTGSWEAKRAALVEWISTNRPQGNNSLTIVFDSRQGLGDRSTSAQLEIVYTAGETADDWISAKVRSVANPRIVVVVSNDRGIHTLVRGTGAKVVTSDAFIQAARKKSLPSHPPSLPDDLHDITDEFKKKWL